MGEDVGDEPPHLRGPDEIGAADMGPQPHATATASSFAVGAGGTVAMAGIDVEAAVGRHLHSPPDQRQRTSSSSPSPEMIPRSPKREAEDELDTGMSKKRVREDADECEDPGSTEQIYRADEPKTDAEGDVVLSDSLPEIEASAETVGNSTQQVAPGQAPEEPPTGTPSSANTTGATMTELPDGTAAAASHG